jgi:glycosyltransferase involved in cell wall biosynthesis
MKISESKPTVIFDGSIFSLQVRGGISRYSFELLRRMPVFFGEGVNINLLYLSGIEKSDYYQQLLDLRISWLPVSLWALVFSPFMATTRSYPARAVYHTPYLFVPRHAKNTRRLLTVHDINYNETPSLRERIREVVQRKSIQNADFITTVSRASLADLKNSFPDLGGAMSVIPNGVDELFFGHYGTDGENNYFLYIGRRDGYKSFIDLITRDVVAFLQNTGLRIKCIGGGALSPKESEQLKKLSADKYFDFEGGCDDRALLQRYSSAVATIVTSRKEGFGLPIIEALAAGSAVVAPDSEVFREVGGNYISYYTAGSSQSLVAALRTVVNREMLHNADQRRQWARQFSWDKTARSTFDIYSDALFG